METPAPLGHNSKPPVVWTMVVDTAPNDQDSCSSYFVHSPLDIEYSNLHVHDSYYQEIWKRSLPKCYFPGQTLAPHFASWDGFHEFVNRCYPLPSTTQRGAAQRPASV